MLEEIQYYSAFMYGGPDGFKHCPIIALNTKDKTYVGCIRFHPTGAMLPEDKMSEDPVKIDMHMHIDMYQNVIDMLRNERPIFLGWHDTYKRGFIFTQKEAVGVGDEDWGPV